MMLYKVSDDRYLGFYSEYGGTVTITGSKNGKPVYSFAGERDEFRIIEHYCNVRKRKHGEPDFDRFVFQKTGTGERITVEAVFVGVAKSVGPNEFVVPG